MAALFNCADPLVLYNCKTCGLSTNERTAYSSHNCKSDNKSEVIYNEDVCDKSAVGCYSKLWISIDQINHEQIEDKKKTKASNEFCPTNKKFSCDQCGHSCNRKYFLESHINDKRTPDIEAIWFKCENLDWNDENKRCLDSDHEDNRSKRMKKYHCNECDYQVDILSHLNRHIMVKHTPLDQINWHKCNSCSYQAKQKSDVTKHIKETHTSTGQVIWLKCHICNFKTKRNHNLKNHLRNKHKQADSQTKQLQCQKCLYKTFDKGSLKRHETIKHTPENLTKWYYCKMCLFRTKWLPYLNEHMKNKHEGM